MSLKLKYGELFNSWARPRAEHTKDPEMRKRIQSIRRKRKLFRWSVRHR